MNGEKKMYAWRNRGERGSMEREREREKDRKGMWVQISTSHLE